VGKDISSPISGDPMFFRTSNRKNQDTAFSFFASGMNNNQYTWSDGLTLIIREDKEVQIEPKT
jgi:hypothetical protein